MSAQTNSSDHNTNVTADPRLLEAGLNESYDSFQQQLDYDHAELPQAAAITGGDLKEVRFESSECPTDDSIKDEASQQQEQPGLKRAWSKAFDWVKDKQQDLSWGTSDPRPSTAFYAKHNEESSSEGQEEIEDEKPLEQIYTKAAAETVSTFLRQDTVLAYQAEKR